MIIILLLAKAKLGDHSFIVQATVMMIVKCDHKTFVVHATDLMLVIT
jgi:hypothetical protein